MRNKLKEIERLLKHAPQTREASEIFQSGGMRVDEAKPEQYQVCEDCEELHGSHRSVTPTPCERDDRRRDAWDTYLTRWSLAYPCKLTLRTQTEVAGDDSYYLRVQFVYRDEPDATDPSRVVVNTGHYGLWPPSDLPDNETPRWIRANLQYHLGHELDEHLSFDGERVFDPHHESIHTCSTCLNEERLQEHVPSLIAEIRKLRRKLRLAMKGKS